MKTPSCVSLTGLMGNGDVECFSIPVLVYPSGGELFSIYIYVEEDTSLSPYLND